MLTLERPLLLSCVLGVRWRRLKSSYDVRILDRPLSSPVGSYRALVTCHGVGGPWHWASNAFENGASMMSSFGGVMAPILNTVMISRHGVVMALGPYGAMTPSTGYTPEMVHGWVAWNDLGARSPA